MKSDRQHASFYHDPTTNPPQKYHHKHRVFSKTPCKSPYQTSLEKISETLAVIDLGTQRG
jgi:hypothetical protein